MRHRVAGRQLGRDSAHRAALRRNLMKDLFRHERVKTTYAKAKSMRGDAEKLITVAKRGKAKRNAGESDVHERRRVASVVQDSEIVHKLFEDLAERFMERPGGYTRVLKLGPRLGDGAEMVILELVE